MSFSLYEASVPLFKQLLGSLSANLDKGAAFAESKKVDPAVLMQQRIAIDMFPLIRQVQVATDQAKGCFARLAGVDIPSYPDDEKTVEEAKARIAKTIAFIDSLSPDAISAAADKEIVLQMGPPTARRELRFSGVDFVMRWVIPNFTFHCTTAYVILRHNGADVGKRDFLGTYT
jgi:uncharacterized protein